MLRSAKGALRSSPYSKRWRGERARLHRKWSYWVRGRDKPVPPVHSATLHMDRPPQGRHQWSPAAGTDDPTYSRGRCRPETRCRHYAGPTDVIAIRFKCCATFYPCIDCHRALADHEPQVWPIAEHDEQAVLCGACGATLGIAEYLNGDSACPRCGAGFNPGCKLHHHLYFETAGV